jgi:hypothetical protein
MSGRGHALSGSVGGAAEREKKREGGGGSSRGSATWRGTASWGLARTGGRRAGTDVGGPRWQQERGGASGARARVGQPEKKMGAAEPR